MEVIKDPAMDFEIALYRALIHHGRPIGAGTVKDIVKSISDSVDRKVTEHEVMEHIKALFNLKALADQIVEEENEEGDDGEAAGEEVTDRSRKTSRDRKRRRPPSPSPVPEAEESELSNVSDDEPAEDAAEEEVEESGGEEEQGDEEEGDEEDEDEDGDDATEIRRSSRTASMALPKKPEKPSNAGKKDKPPAKKAKTSKSSNKSPTTSRDKKRKVRVASTVSQSPSNRAQR